MSGSCSQCGGDTDRDYSHCEDHRSSGLTCLFCKRRLTTALCPTCGALEMAVWDPAADDDEKARRGEETELERMLKKSIERAKEMRHAK